MVEGGDTRHIWCERHGQSVSTTPLQRGGGAPTPPPITPGVAKPVRIEGVDGVQFFCFTDAHPGQDHLFRVGQHTVTVPEEEFRKAGRKLFLSHEVVWK